MTKSISVKRKKRGRPATGTEPLYGIRIADGLMKQIMDWGKSNGATRSEAIRRLVELGLTVQTGVRPKSEGQRRRASEMAGSAIDEAADTTASSNDQASRKRRLIKGPEEFQKVRRDRNPK